VPHAGNPCQALRRCRPSCMDHDAGWPSRRHNDARLRLSDRCGHRRSSRPTVFERRFGLVQRHPARWAAGRLPDQQTSRAGPRHPRHRAGDAHAELGAIWCPAKPRRTTLDRRKREASRGIDPSSSSGPAPLPQPVNQRWDRACSGPRRTHDLFLFGRAFLPGAGGFSSPKARCRARAARAPWPRPPPLRS